MCASSVFYSLSHLPGPCRVLASGQGVSVQLPPSVKAAWLRERVTVIPGGLMWQSHVRPGGMLALRSLCQRWSVIWGDRYLWEDGRADG